MPGWQPGRKPSYIKQAKQGSPTPNRQRQPWRPPLACSTASSPPCGSSSGLVVVPPAAGAGAAAAAEASSSSPTTAAAAASSASTATSATMELSSPALRFCPASTSPRGSEEEPAAAEREQQQQPRRPLPVLRRRPRRVLPPRPQPRTTRRRPTLRGASSGAPPREQPSLGRGPSPPAAPGAASRGRRKPRGALAVRRIGDPCRDSLVQDPGCGGYFTDDDDHGKRGHLQSIRGVVVAPSRAA